MSSLDRSIFKFDPTDFEFEIIKLLEDLAPPGKHSARNAIWHLNRAWMIRELDPEMAALRAITAEEEAASALFNSLQRRHYVNASKLRKDNHGHKSALIPFLDAARVVISESLKGAPFSEPPAVTLDTNVSQPRLRVMLRLVSAPGQDAFPEPPLNFSFDRSDGPLPFVDEFHRRMKSLGLGSVEKILKDRARRREHLLYAEDTGLGRLSDPAVLPLLESFRKAVFRVLVFTLLIDPYAERSPFVQTCLDAFTEILDTAGKKFSFTPPSSASPNSETY